MKESPALRRVLLTAFAAYRDGESFYAENASQLAAERLASQPPRGVTLETRIYPVDFQTIRRRVEEDLSAGHDFMILTGQAPSSKIVRLEMSARNLGVDPSANQKPFPLAPDGPIRLESTIDWPHVLGSLAPRSPDFELSQDAGTYLCNAALYFAILAARRRWEAGARESPTRVGFIHVPLAQQANSAAPCMPTEQTAERLRELIEIAALS